MDIKDKRVLITGTTSGLGQSLAIACLNKKSYVFGISKSSSPPQLKHPRYIHFQCDLTNISQLEKITKELPQIDILINNAGRWVGSDIEDTFTDIKYLLDTNVTGTISMTKYLLPNLEKASHAKIINICSTSSLKGRADEAVYAASKWAIYGFTESLKLKYKDNNIEVIGVFPGGMKTNFYNHGKKIMDTATFIEPEKIAEIILDVIQKDNGMTIDHLVINRRS